MLLYPDEGIVFYIRILHLLLYPDERIVFYIKILHLLLYPDERIVFYIKILHLLLYPDERIVFYIRILHLLLYPDERIVFYIRILHLLTLNTPLIITRSCTLSALITVHFARTNILTYIWGSIGLRKELRTFMASVHVKYEATAWVTVCHSAFIWQ